jgi:hypothetical protein
MDQGDGESESPSLVLDKKVNTKARLDFDGPVATRT